jgi:hypothetical protein
VKHLKDPLLGLFLLRLYEGSPTHASCGSIEKLLWHEYLLPLARLKNDPWLMSIGRWRLKQYRNAYRCVLGCDVVVSKTKSSLNGKDGEEEVLDAEDSKRDKKRLTPSLKAATAPNAPTISFLCTDEFDTSLSAFARCMSKMSQLSSTLKKKKKKNNVKMSAFAPDPFDTMGQSSLFAQFAVPSSRLQQQSTVASTKESEDENDEEETCEWPPREAEDALSVRTLFVSLSFTLAYSLNQSLTHSLTDTYCLKLRNSRFVLLESDGT